MRTLLPKVLLIAITALSLMCVSEDKNSTVVDVFFTEQPMGGRAVDTLRCEYTLYYHYEYTPPLFKDRGYDGKHVNIEWKRADYQWWKPEGSFDFFSNGTTPPEIWVDSTATAAAPPGEHLSGTYWLQIQVSWEDSDGRPLANTLESNHVECYE